MKKGIEMAQSYRIGIGARILLGFCAPVMLLLLIAVAAHWALSRVTNDLKLLTEDRVVKVMEARNIRDNVNEIAIASRNLLLLPQGDPLRGKELERIELARTSNAELTRQLQKTVTSERGRELLKSVASAREAYNKATDSMLSLLNSGHAEMAAEILFKELRPTQQAYTDAMRLFVDFQVKLMTKAKADSLTATGQASVSILVACLFALVVAAVVGTLVARSVTRPLGGEPEELTEAARAISSGDLTTRLDVRRARPGSAVAAMAEMQSALSALVGQVRLGSDNIATGSSQIATGNADLSQRTEEQASNLQQTAASMEQLSSTVKANAETTRQADHLAAQASAAAVRGGETVSDVVTTMQEISASSKKIADIIGVIDGIAFQTNILALNAAVEAARAGDQGRGFAVVATEVRSLAARSATAAREIKTLIGASVEKVETGALRAREAGSAMEEIVNRVQRVTQLISEVTNATGEQTSGIAQVGDAVSQLDKVTQQNAALVEESAAAAESLSQQASKLADLVATFKLPPEAQRQVAA
jgi:methyl-accepting chemotaxis protein